MIRPTKFADIAGVSRGTISKAIASGRLALENGRIDENGESASAFLSDLEVRKLARAGRQQPPGEKTLLEKPVIASGIDLGPKSAQPGCPRGDRQDAELRKAWAAAQKLEIQNQKAVGELVERKSVSQFMGRLYGIHTNVIVPLGSKISDQVAAEFGTQDPAKVLRVQQIIEGETYGALSQIKRDMSDYLSKIESEIPAELKEATK